jgi:hypothetical protein
VREQPRQPLIELRLVAQDRRDRRRQV